MKQDSVTDVDRLLEEQMEVAEQLRRALSSGPERAPGLSHRYRALFHDIDELLPPDPDPLIDL